MRKKKRKQLSVERLYELILEEKEHNPIVGTAFWETKLFLIDLGYTLSGAERAVLRVEKTYDLNLYRRPHDNHHTENGSVINSEFGVTRTSNKSAYSKLLAFYCRRLKEGVSKEQALKETHEHYDPILAKELGREPQTADVAMVVPKSLSASGRCKDLSDLEIEI